jgi:hypothetical protein
VRCEKQNSSKNHSESKEALETVIAKLSAQVQSMHEAITKLTQSNNGKDNLPKPPTYAQEVSADFVKTAVALALQEQQQVITDKCCIAVYSFLEEVRTKLNWQNYLATWDEAGWCFTIPELAEICMLNQHYVC